MASDGHAICLLTGTPAAPQEQNTEYTNLRLVVITKGGQKWERGVAKPHVVEGTPSPDTPRLAIGDVVFERGHPVATLVSRGEAVAKVKIGEGGPPFGATSHEERVFAADSCRHLVRSFSELAWKFAALAGQPAPEQNAIVSPLSTATIAAAIYRSSNPPQRAKLFERTLHKLAPGKKYSG